MEGLGSDGQGLRETRLTNEAMIDGTPRSIKYAEWPKTACGRERPQNAPMKAQM